MDERDFKAMNDMLRDDTEGFLLQEDCVYHSLLDRHMCPNKNVCVICSDVKSELYQFVITNNNGFVFKSNIPCDNISQANRVKLEILKSKNIKSVSFEIEK